MTKRHNALAMASGLAAVVPDLTRLDEVDVHLRELDEQEREIHRGDLPYDEVAERLLAAARRRRAQFTDNKGGLLWDVQNVISGLRDGDVSVDSVDQLFNLLLWIWGDAIDERIQAACARLTYPQGLRSEERMAQEASIAEARAALVAEREALVDHINAAAGGTIEIQHLPATIRRRQNDALKAEREAQRAQRQAAIEAARAAADARRPQTISPYVLD